jgi:Flp pilus assembly pilin Flp
MLETARRLFHEDKGTTAIEYGLIASLIVLAVAVAMPLLGVSVRGLFQNILDAFPR